MRLNLLLRNASLQTQNFKWIINFMFGLRFGSFIGKEEEQDPAHCCYSSPAITSELESQSQLKIESALSMKKKCPTVAILNA